VGRFEAGSRRPGKFELRKESKKKNVDILIEVVLRDF